MACLLYTSDAADECVRGKFTESVFGGGAAAAGAVSGTAGGRCGRQMGTDHKISWRSQGSTAAGRLPCVIADRILTAGLCHHDSRKGRDREAFPATGN